MNNIKLYAEERQRVDKYVSNTLHLSRTIVETLLGEGKILVNGKEVRKKYILNQGDRIDVELVDPVAIDIKATKMDLDIVYEDDDLLIINKPKGMVVHPAPGNYENTLVNGLLAYNPKLSTINGEFRPGIVHRIDKDTSGLLVVAKNNASHNHLALQFQEHSIGRKYLALVLGNITEDTGEIRLPIGRDPKSRIRMAVVRDGKEAVTHYRVLEHFPDYSLVECQLETGRTHQIRVHMAYLKHPVAGDPLYGKKTPLIPLEGQVLHAFHLGIIHPSTGEYMAFDAPLPDYFQHLLGVIRGE